MSVPFQAFEEIANKNGRFPEYLSLFVDGVPGLPEGRASPPTPTPPIIHSVIGGRAWDREKAAAPTPRPKPKAAVLVSSPRNSHDFVRHHASPMGVRLPASSFFPAGAVSPPRPTTFLDRQGCEPAHPALLFFCSLQLAAFSGPPETHRIFFSNPRNKIARLLPSIIFPPSPQDSRYRSRPPRFFRGLDGSLGEGLSFLRPTPTQQLTAAFSSPPNSSLDPQDFYVESMGRGSESGPWSPNSFFWSAKKNRPFCCQGRPGPSSHTAPGLPHSIRAQGGGARPASPPQLFFAAGGCTSPPPPGYEGMPGRQAPPYQGPPGALPVPFQ